MKNKQIWTLESNWSKCTLLHEFSVSHPFELQFPYLKSGYKFLSSNARGKYSLSFHKSLSEISWNALRITTFPACNRNNPRICVSKHEAKPLLPPTNDWVTLLDSRPYLNTPAGALPFPLCRGPGQLHALFLEWIWIWLLMTSRARLWRTNLIRRQKERKLKVLGVGVCVHGQNPRINLNM